MPDPAELALQAVAWHEALADVPDADLDIVYRRAIQGHTGTFPLGTGDMRIAWERISAEREHAAQLEAYWKRDAEYRAREAEQAAHRERLTTDPEYRTAYEAKQAEHQAQMDRVRADLAAARARDRSR